jgi:hypothetical protein
MNIQRPPALDDEVSPPRKKVKTVPVRLVPKPERGEPRQGFTKCKLHFEQAKLNTAMQVHNYHLHLAARVCDFAIELLQVVDDGSPKEPLNFRSDVVFILTAKNKDRE